jgi:lysophospholipase L1-like esterase
MDSMRANLSQVLSEIRGLRHGMPTSVLVTGYWNVFEDGQVARRASGDLGLRASIELTRKVNATIQGVADNAGAHYVDLFAPFQSHGSDIDALMAPDGDHPDAAGHRLIAETLLGAGLPRLPGNP